MGKVKLTAQERRELSWLGENPYSWGGHALRKQPPTDSDIIVWLRAGLIEFSPTYMSKQSGARPITCGGYILTPAGRAILEAGNEA